MYPIVFFELVYPMTVWMAGLYSNHAIPHSFGYFTSFNKLKIIINKTSLKISYSNNIALSIEHSSILTCCIINLTTQWPLLLKSCNTGR